MSGNANGQPELPLLHADLCSNDPWEHAIAQARAEIRQFVEDGEIGHEDVTAQCGEQWATDIHHDRLAA